ncbi:MAG: T9SS type A sorting domain-containing protein [Chitinophagaceae bacterium]|nr:T9SS type A sorting domain-containing protein [Chitinophagaceae bacterium]
MKKLIVLVAIVQASLFVQAQTPAFEWARAWQVYSPFYGNSSMQVDREGNVLATGGFLKTVDFDPGPAVLNFSASASIPGDSFDAFVFKVNDKGALLWARAFGGKMDDMGYSIDIDQEGNVYTVGYFNDTVDMDPGPGIFTLVAVNGPAMFLHKLDKDGNFIWAKSIEGKSNRLIDIGADGYLYLSGNFYDTTDFDPGPGTFTLNGAGSYMLKLDLDGNFVWAKKTTNEKGHLVTSLKSRNRDFFLAGELIGTSDFDPDTGTYVLSGYGTHITKFDDSGKFIWNRFFPRSIVPGSGAQVSFLGTDSLKNLYAAGSLYGSIDFDPGADSFRLSSNIYGDIFVLKLDSNGNFIWAKKIGGALTETRASMYVDSAGNSYISGEFEGSADFDPDPVAEYILKSFGFYDIFLLKLDPEGKFVWAKSVGGPKNNIAINIKTGPDGCIYHSGMFSEEIYFDQKGKDGLYDPGGNGNLFIHKMNFNPAAIGASPERNRFAIYPNPLQDQFYIDFGTTPYRGHQVMVVNQLGQTVFRDDRISSNRFDLKNITPGLYRVIVLKEDVPVFTQNIVKQ